MLQSYNSKCNCIFYNDIRCLCATQSKGLKSPLQQSTILVYFGCHLIAAPPNIPTEEALVLEGFCDR